MVKTIRLLGMEIENYSLREELMHVEAFYEKNELSIIRTMTMKQLALAVEDQSVRDGISMADMVVMGDKEILSEAGIQSAQRLREASEHVFMQELLKRIYRNRCKVFLAVEHLGQEPLLRDFLTEKHGELQIVGAYAAEECNGEPDILFNEVNASAADTVLSVICSPLEEMFLVDAKAKLAANIWYSLGEWQSFAKSRSVLYEKCRKLIHKGKFKNVVHSYEQGNE